MIIKAGAGTATRYVAPIYAVCVVGAVLLIVKACEKAKMSSAICLICACVVGAMLNTGWKTYEWPELYKDAKVGYEISKEYGQNNECIYIVKNRWRNLVSYPDFLQYLCISYVHETELEMLEQEQYSEYDSVVMYFDKNTGDEKIDEILAKMIERNPELNTYSKLYEYSYNVAYYLE